MNSEISLSMRNHVNQRQKKLFCVDPLPVREMGNVPRDNKSMRPKMLQANKIVFSAEVALAQDQHASRKAIMLPNSATLYTTLRLVSFTAPRR